MDKYKKRGLAQMAVSSIIVLFVGLAVVTLIIIFSGSLGGQTWQLVEADVDAITNTTIKESVKQSVISSFEAQATGAQYLPLVVLAVVIFIVLALVLSASSLAQGGFGRGGGSAL